MENQRHQFIEKIKKNPNDVYNVCMIAHVDHGKTSLTDCLISSNKIFSRKMNGKLLYLDSREDEQEREITMKSSAVSLLTPQNVSEEKKLINLIDSPGHMDFEFEVISGLKLCDGGILIIDVVEGVSTQTIHLMKKAIDNNLKLILVLNKMDKLFEYFNLSPDEIYYHIDGIIQTANASLNVFLEQKIQEQIELNPKLNVEKVREIYQSDDYFSPLKNNVIFGSVIDGWGFRIYDIAEQYAKKWGMKTEPLSKCFYGEFYYDIKQKKISKKDSTGKKKTIFVQYCLSVIQNIYNAVFNKDEEQLKKIQKFMGINISDRDLKHNPKNVLNEIMHNWLPIENNVFKCILGKLPNTKDGQQKRISQISEDWQGNEILKNAVMSCSQEGDPIAIISKFVPIKQNQKLKFIGIGRLLRGTLKIGDKVTLRNLNKEKYEMNLKHLYYWMGSKTVDTDIVYAGNIFGFMDEDLNSFKTAYIASIEFQDLLPILHERSLIKVRIFCENIQDMPRLVEGLKILNRIDPVCEVYNDENGEYILMVNGEIHLERCIKDLENDYFGKKIMVSDFLVDFKETAIEKEFFLVKKQKKIKNDENDNEDEQENIKQDEQKEIVQESKKIVKKEEVEKIEIKPQKIYERYDMDDFDYEYLKDLDSDQSIEEEVQKIEESDSDDENAFDHEIDSKFMWKKQDFIYQDIKSNVKEVNKQSKKMKVKKFNLHQLVTEKKNYCSILTPDNSIKVSMQVVSLPLEISEFLLKNEQLLKEVLKVEKKSSLYYFFKELNKLIDQYVINPFLRVLIKKHLICFGPKLYGQNMFVNVYCDSKENIFSKHQYNIKLNEKEEKFYKIAKDKLQFETFPEDEIFHLQGEIQLGVLEAMSSGPLCQENMYGCLFILEKIWYMKDEEQNLKENPKEKIIENFQKVIKIFEENQVQILPTIKEACNRVFLGASPKLVESYYDIIAYTNDEKTQNNYCDAIKQKQGKITEMDYKYEFNMNQITAKIPINQSYGLYKDILTATSGKVIPQIKFGGWEIIDQDPFYEQNFNEESKELHGEDLKIKNYARELLESIRERKGLAVNKKLIQNADKQNTLNNSLKDLQSMFEKPDFIQLDKHYYFSREMKSYFMVPSPHRMSLLLDPDFPAKFTPVDQTLTVIKELDCLQSVISNSSKSEIVQQAQQLSKLLGENSLGKKLSEIKISIFVKAESQSQSQSQSTSKKKKKKKSKIFDIVKNIEFFDQNKLIKDYDFFLKTLKENSKNNNLKINPILFLNIYKVLPYKQKLQEFETKHLKHLSRNLKMDFEKMVELEKIVEQQFKDFACIFTSNNKLQEELQKSLIKNKYSENLLENEDFLFLFQNTKELKQITENKEYKIEIQKNEYLQSKNCDDNKLVFLIQNKEDIDKSFQILEKLFKEREIFCYPIFWNQENFNEQQKKEIDLKLQNHAKNQDIDIKLLQSVFYVNDNQFEDVFKQLKQSDKYVTDTKIMKIFTILSKFDVIPKEEKKVILDSDQIFSLLASKLKQQINSKKQITFEEFAKTMNSLDDQEEKNSLQEEENFQQNQPSSLQHIEEQNEIQEQQNLDLKEKLEKIKEQLHSLQLKQQDLNDEHMNNQNSFKQEFENLKNIKKQTYNKFEERIKEQNIINEQQQQKIEELQKNENLNKEFQDKILNLQKQIEEDKKEYEKLQQQLLDNKKQNDDKEKKEDEQINESLENEIQNLKQKIDENLKEKNKFDNDKQQLEEQINNLQKQIVEYQNEKNVQEEDKKKLEENILNLQQNVEKGKNDYEMNKKELEDQIKNLQQQIEKGKNDYATIQKQLQDKIDQNQKNNINQQNLEEEIKNLKKQITDNQEEQTINEQQNQDSTDQIFDYYNQIKQKSIQEIEYNDQSELQNEIENLKNQNIKLKQNIEINMQDKDNNLKQLQENYDNLQNEYKEIKNQLLQQNNSIEQQKQELEKNYQIQKDLQNEKTILEQKNKEFQEEIQKQEQQQIKNFEEEQNKIKEYQQQEQDIKEEINKLNSQKESINQEIKIQEDKQIKFKEEYKNLQRQQQETQEYILENNVTQLKKQIKEQNKEKFILIDSRKKILSMIINKFNITLPDDIKVDKKIELVQEFIENFDINQQDQQNSQIEYLKEENEKLQKENEQLLKDLEQQNKELVQEDEEIQQQQEVQQHLEQAWDLFNKNIIFQKEYFNSLIDEYENENHKQENEEQIEKFENLIENLKKQNCQIDESIIDNLKHNQNLFEQQKNKMKELQEENKNLQDQCLQLLEDNDDQLNKLIQNSKQEKQHELECINEINNKIQLAQKFENQIQQIKEKEITLHERIEELKDYEQKVKEQNQNIFDLKNIIDGLQNNNLENVNDTLNYQENKIQEYEKNQSQNLVKIKEQNQQIQLLKKKIHDLQEQIELLNKQKDQQILKQLSSEEEIQKQELDQYDEDQLKEEIKELKYEINLLEQSNKKKDQEIQELNEKISQLQEKEINEDSQLESINSLNENNQQIIPEEGSFDLNQQNQVFMQENQQQNFNQFFQKNPNNVFQKNDIVQPSSLLNEKQKQSKWNLNKDKNQLPINNDVNKKNYRQIRKYITFNMNLDYEKIENELLQSSINLESFGIRLLAIALQSQDKKLIKIFLEKGADITLIEENIVKKYLKNQEQNDEKIILSNTKTIREEIERQKNLSKNSNFESHEKFLEEKICFENTENQPQFQNEIQLII